ncbi:MAG: pyridoxal 4-dehydrogenase [Pelagibacterium sp. SCN 63-23]|nr:MAG: pyridoxal 4-dehydrogenase [Pelagibacterium sp. SCN 63-23]
MRLDQLRPLGGTGLTCTAASFGAAGIGNLYKAVSSDQAASVLGAAWDCGIRYFDTAPRYGHGLSERRLGDFLRSKPRDSYLISTKVGRLLTPLRGRQPVDHGFVDPLPFAQEYDYSYDGIMRSFEDSLQRLGLDRVDILYMHDIGQDTHGVANTDRQRIAFDGGLRAMMQLRAEGLVGGIGLGVNEVRVCLDALEYADLDAFLIAGRYTLLDHAGARPLIEACRVHGASLVVGGVFNSGILATGPVPGAVFDYEPASDEILHRTAQIQAVCREFNIDLPTAALQFALAGEVVSSVLLGVSSERNLSRNQTGFHTALPNEFWDTLVDRGMIQDWTRPTC